MKNLLIRSLSGSVYVLLIIGSLLINKHLFALVLFFFLLVGTSEFLRFEGNKKIVVLPVIIAGILFLFFHFIFIGYLPFQWSVLAFLTPLLILASGLFQKDGKVFKSLTFKLLPLVYVVVPLVLADYINVISTAKYSKLLFAVFILVWANDSFAYLTGMSIGKHKLFERITPKKTWEGFIGGIIGTMLAAWFLKDYVGVNSIVFWELTALSIAIVSVIGDFIESLFKRNAGVKDSGKIMPGHGGILDRIDSLLFVFPIVYIYFQLSV